MAAGGKDVANKAAVTPADFVPEMPPEEEVPNAEHAERCLRQAWPFPVLGQFACQNSRFPFDSVW